MACLPAVVLDNAAADGTVRLSAARAPVLADTVAQNRFLVISESLHGASDILVPKLISVLVFILFSSQNFYFI